MTRRWALAILVGVGLSGLTGCGAQSGTAAPSTPGKPSRPATLNLSTIDPCTLLTAGQRAQLGVGAGQSSATDYGGPNKGPSCTWLSPSLHPGFTYSGFAVLNRGVAAVHSTEPPRTVAGFPAVTTGTIGTDPARYCQLFVDVAPNQALSTAFDTSDGDPVPAMTHQTACDRAQHAAELMLGNVPGAH